MSWFRVATGCERETINAAALRFLPNKRDADLQNWGCECFCSTAAATMSIFDVYPRSLLTFITARYSFSHLSLRTFSLAHLHLTPDGRMHQRSHGNPVRSSSISWWGIPLLDPVLCLFKLRRAADISETVFQGCAWACLWPRAGMPDRM